jgi:serine phosphatase RsbU (regulator of sigma subunit)
LPRDTSERPSALRPARRLATTACVAVSCFGLLALIPAASARPNHVSRTSPAPAVEPAPAAAPPAELAPASPSPASGQSAGPAAPSQTPPRPTPKHAQRGGANQTPAVGGSSRTGASGGASQTAAGEDPSQTTTSGDPAQPPAHRDRSQRAHARASAPTKPAAASVESSPASAEQQSAVLQESTAQADAGRQRGRGHHKETAGEGKHSRESGKRGKEKSKQPAPPSAAPEEPTLETAVPAAAAAAPVTIASIEATPPAQAPVQDAAQVSVAGVSAQALDSPARAAGHGASHARAARVPRRTHRALPAASEPALAFATSAAHRSRASASKDARGAHDGGSRGGSSPLVRTITTIVDVVPTPVRLLIAGLLALALALAARSYLAALRARSLERQRAQLLEDVGLLQAALLPSPPARLGPVGTSVAYRPAEGPGAGGDFYDVFALEDGQLAVIVGDVSGHGRHALPHTALLRFTLRAYLEAGLSPRDAVQTAGAVLERQLGGLFATVVLATYNPRERILVYSCAGHPPPVVIGADPGPAAIAPLTVCASPPIGVGVRTGTRQTVVSVPGRSQICFYTDGVTESRVGTELFGVERLVDTLIELGADASAPAILDSVVRHADARPDDMAACLLRIEGGDDAPSVLSEELELDGEEIASERAERLLLACGVERSELAEVIRSARAAAGRNGTVVLELHRTDGAPHVTLRRDRLAYLHARRASVEAAV